MNGSAGDTGSKPHTGGGAGQGGESGSPHDDCAAGLDLCDGKCTNLATDEAHCGDCTTECATGQSCKSGKCETAGPAPELVIGAFDASVSAPLLAVAEDGSAVAAWLVGDALYVTTFEPIDKIWSTPRRAAEHVTGRPHLAMNAAGDAALVWTQGGGDAVDVLLARFDRSEQFWPEVEVVDQTDVDAKSPAVAIADDGTLAVQWIETHDLIDRTEFHLVARRTTPSGALDDSAVTLTTAASGHSIASGRGGETFSVWEHLGNVKSRSWSGSAWTEAEDIAPGDGRAFVSQLRAFVDGDGDATVLIERTVSNALPAAGSLSAARFVDGTWSPTQPVARGYHPFYSNAAQDRQGDIFVSWQEQNTPDFVPYLCAARSDAATDTWSGPSCIVTSSTAITNTPRVVVNQADGALFLFRWPHPVGRQTYAARLTAPEDELSAAEPYPPDAETPEPVALAYSQRGKGLALWVDRTATQNRVLWYEL